MLLPKLSTFCSHPAVLLIKVGEKAVQGVWEVSVLTNLSSVVLVVSSFFNACPHVLKINLYTLSVPALGLSRCRRAGL